MYIIILILVLVQNVYEVEKISDHVIYLRDGKPSDFLNLEKSEENGLTIELDTKNSRAALEQVFKEVHLNKIDYNGGVYILSFTEGTSFNDVLMAISKNNFNIQYIRDISTSTRRFFVS